MKETHKQQYYDDVTNHSEIVSSNFFLTVTFFLTRLTEGPKPLHMTNQKSFSAVKNFVFALSFVCFVASCQDDKMLAVTEDVETKAASEVAAVSNIESLTITGSNTVFAEGSVDCRVCSYIVDANTETIDGLELGLKPGSIICLKSALTYGNLSFVNLEGTEENPITIATAK